MSLSDLASLGSFFSGVAVIVTFLFLTLQMRQTNRNQRALMQQGRAGRTTDLLMRLSEARQSSLMVRGMRGELDLTSDEVQSLVRTYASFYWNYEDSYLQFKAGTLNPEAWESDLEVLTQFASEPSARVAWKFLRICTGGAFRKFVDGMIATSRCQMLPDFAATWKALMKKELVAISGATSHAG
jgi:hypothetical protein